MLAALSAAQLAAQGSYIHFEARQVHPLALCPDGNTLLALDSANARLCRFDLREDPPRRLPPIPVGLEPTTVRARNNDEVWVCNEVSDSVSVISLQANAVMDTLVVGDEPTDLIFAQGRAFVVCARSRELRVFDASSRMPLGSVALQGLQPHAMALSADGNRLWVACLLSGNGSTVLPRADARPQGTPQNPSLPAAPATTEIVSTGDPRVKHQVLDHDLIEVDPLSLEVLSHRGGVGTHLFDLSMRPGGSELWVCTQDSRNLTRFEPALRGHVVDSALVALDGNQRRRHDLNPGLDYALLPNPAAQAVALAMPTSLCFSANGSQLWVAAFGSDRIARIDADTGAIAARVDLRIGADPSAAAMRGPRGLQLDESRQRLYVLNKLSSSLSVVDTVDESLRHELPLAQHDPMPAAIRRGRGYLFDARLSGNGTVSCASCHLDADRDGLAWDLGDPGGEMITVMGSNLSVHDNTARPRALHPMKGPMVTQTLRGLAQGAPFHWRGDRPTLQSFNSTFDKLMGGSLQDQDDMNDLATYLNSLAHHSNPNRNLDRSLPTQHAGGNPLLGRDLFNHHTKSHCNTCHSLPQGSDHNLDLPQEAGLSQPIKNPPLRTLYQRLDFDPRPGVSSLSGFGLLHDGTGGRTLLPTVHPYVLDQLSTASEFANLSAFLLCFDTGTGRTVGHSFTLNAQRLGDSNLRDQIALLESRASLASPDCDVVAHGSIAGLQRFWCWRQGRYHPDRSDQPALSREDLLALIKAQDRLTLLGVPAGAGARLSIDEDGDGVLNGDDPHPGLEDGPPRILEHPRQLAVTEGSIAIFAVEAAGVDLQFQWRRSGSPVGDNAATLEIAAASAADVGDYTVTVSNALGSVTSAKAGLRLVAGAQILRHPLSQSVAEGGNAHFSVSASGSNLTYQWWRGNQLIGGARQATLRLPGVRVHDAGLYSVEVSNGATSVRSQAAELAVRPWPVITPPAFSAIMVGQTVQWQLSAIPHPTSFSADGLPAGLRLDPASGRITGRAIKAGIHRLRLRAKNANGTGEAVEQTLRVLELDPQVLGVFEATLARHHSASLGGELGGWLQLATTTAASFSGSLQIGALKHNFNGLLDTQSGSDPHGRALILRRGQAALELTLDLARDGSGLSAWIADGSNSISATGRRRVAAAGSWQGAYTMAMKPPADAAGPGGWSLGAMTLGATGASNLVIRLADGSPAITRGLWLRDDQSFALLALHNGGRASLLGQWILGQDGDLAPSQVSWLSLTHRSSRSYRDGFASMPLQVIGRRWTPTPPGQLPMGLMPTEGNARLRFGGAGVLNPQNRLDWNPFTVRQGSTLQVVPPSLNPAALLLRLGADRGSWSAGNSGSFFGSFTLSDEDGPEASRIQRRGNFFGLLVDDGNGQRGCGFFNLPQLPSQAPAGSTAATSPMLSGWVELQPYTFGE